MSRTASLQFTMFTEATARAYLASCKANGNRTAENYGDRVAHARAAAPHLALAAHPKRDLSRDRRVPREDDRERNDVVARREEVRIASAFGDRTGCESA